MTQDDRGLPWQHRPREQENFSDSFSTGGVGKRLTVMPGKKASWGRDQAEPQLQDSPEQEWLQVPPQQPLTQIGRRLSGTQHLQVMPETQGQTWMPPWVSHPASLAQRSTETSAGDSSPVCFPKRGNSRDLLMQGTHTPAQGLAPAACLAAAEGGGSLPVPVGWRALPKPSHPLSPTLVRVPAALSQGW